MAFSEGFNPHRFRINRKVRNLTPPEERMVGTTCACGRKLLKFDGVWSQYVACRPWGEEGGHFVHPVSIELHAAPSPEPKPKPKPKPEPEPEQEPEQEPEAPTQERGDASLIDTLVTVLEPRLRRASVDPGQVRTIAADVTREILASEGGQQERRTVVEIQRGGTTIATVADAHYMLPRLVTLMEAGLHVYLWGPPGTGKTTAAMQAAEALGRKAEVDTLDRSTFRSMVQGYMTPAGEPVHTVFTRCWTEGKVYVADEVDNAPGHVQTLYNSALANGHAPLAWGNIARADGFGFIGTGNTPGRPTRAFPDRSPMSAAFADRLYFLYWPLDPAIEARVGGLGHTARKWRPRSGSADIGAWVEWVLRFRSWAERNAPTVQVTPRASIEGAKALRCGETYAQVADGLVFRGCDDELKGKALAAVGLPSHG